MDATFLIVEDDPLLGPTYKRAASRRGEVLLARSVAEANEVTDKAAHLTALIADWFLPDGTGLQVLVKQRKSRSAIPAMIVTGQWEPAAADAACEHGASFLMKPVAPARLDDFLVKATRSAAGAAQKGSKTAPPLGAPSTVETTAMTFLDRLTAGRVEELVARYELGCRAHRIRYGSPGDGSLQELAAAARMEISVVRRHARVSEVIPPDEFRLLLEARTTSGQPLTWTHLERFSLVRSRSRRLALEHEVLACGQPNQGVRVKGPRRAE